MSGSVPVRERRVVAHRLEQRRPAEHVRRLRRSMRSSAAAGSKRSVTRTVAAGLQRGAEDQRAADPEERERAEEARRRAVGGLQQRRAPAVARTTVPCVCTTPFGSALDPDVYVTCARSAGTTSASISASSVVGDVVGPRHVEVERRRPRAVGAAGEPHRAQRRRARGGRGAGRPRRRGRARWPRACPACRDRARRAR